MFQTGLNTRVTGYTAKEAVMKYAPDGREIAEFTLGVGDGSVKYPTTWVTVPVWEELAREVLKVIDRKGIAVEASGMLQIRLYEGKHGKAVAVELKNVREVKVCNRDGEVERVLSGEKTE